MKLEPSTEKDVQQLSRWITADPYHKDCLDPVWWLTGSGLLTFCLQDDKGPVCYVRLDEENEVLIRLHTQFGPREEVSKLRLIKGMLYCFPMVRIFCNHRYSSIVFNSVSPLLIDFMERKYGFQPVGGNDYVLPFKVSV